MSSGPIAEYVDGLVEHFTVVAGRALDGDVSVVGFDDRATSTMAVVYALPERALVACAPQLAERLAHVADRSSPDRLLADLVAAGGTVAHEGTNHVWEDPDREPAVPAPPDPLRWLDAGSDADLELVRRLVAEADPDDVDEAEIDPDVPDPRIVVSVAPEGRTSAYASGRPFWAIAEADDVGVLVHPAHRRRGLGAAVVAEFVRRERRRRPQLYRHDSLNHGSAGVARSVGFTQVHLVHAVTFG